jgi:hypothetical protein
MTLPCNFVKIASSHTQARPSASRKIVRGCENKDGKRHFVSPTTKKNTMCLINCVFTWQQGKLWGRLLAFFFPLGDLQLLHWEMFPILLWCYNRCDNTKRISSTQIMIYLPIQCYWSVWKPPNLKLICPLIPNSPMGRISAFKWPPTLICHYYFYY